MIIRVEIYLGDVNLHMYFGDVDSLMYLGDSYMHYLFNIPHRPVIIKCGCAGDVSTVIGLAPALKFNGGGHINHTIFWQNLAPGGGEPEGV